MLRTDGWTDGRTDNVKTVYPLQTKFAGGIIKQRQNIQGIQRKWLGVFIEKHLNLCVALTCYCQLWPIYAMIAFSQIMVQ